nr:hypothetical protein HmN_000949100 [Hymenolepis microstoma]
MFVVQAPNAGPSQEVALTAKTSLTLDADSSDYRAPVTGSHPSVTVPDGCRNLIRRCDDYHRKLKEYSRRGAMLINVTGVIPFRGSQTSFDYVLIPPSSFTLISIAISSGKSIV